jgi:hypothetical protein
VLLVSFTVVQVGAGEYATIPLRLARQRSTGFASLYAFALSASLFVMMYYIPVWFQAVRGDSATHSGANTLPLTMSVVVGTMIAGIGTTKLGYYVPFVYAAVVLGTAGAGSIYTCAVDASTAMTAGYQVVFGLGIGLGLQQPLVAIQAVLPASDLPTGTAMIVFAQNFGGSLPLSVAQNAFINRLVSGLEQIPGNIDPARVVNSGATQITSLTKDPSLLSDIKFAYNDGLKQTFLVSLVSVCVAIIGAVGVEWKSVKRKPIDENAPIATESCTEA